MPVQRSATSSPGMLKFVQLGPPTQTIFKLGLYWWLAFDWSDILAFVCVYIRFVVSIVLVYWLSIGPQTGKYMLHVVAESHQIQSRIKYTVLPTWCASSLSGRVDRTRMWSLSAQEDRTRLWRLRYQLDWFKLWSMCGQEDRTNLQSVHPGIWRKSGMHTMFDQSEVQHGGKRWKPASSAANIQRKRMCHHYW